ncbi:hypothetical protein ABEB36_002767 [Hypothenemus hampei]|uniref:Uncharacterized protein n=1 Tax=Hypothenemus hampei TaxID=57062 RepID=A0ABD1F7J2_HYPHA
MSFFTSELKKIDSGRTNKMDAICGKIGIITGGANGIGAAYVRRLFKAGMQGCTITDTDETNGEKLAEDVNKSYGNGKALFIKGDMTNKKSFECVFEEHKNHFQQLDVLINNAGILRDKTWEHMINLNVTATVRGTLLGMKYMGKNNGGCGGTIVNTASILGLRDMAGCPCYTGTKHFVVGFTRSMGNKFWFDLTGIRFLTICPGVTITPLITDAEKWVFDGFPGLGKVLSDGLGSQPPQTVDDLAEGLNTILNEGENGSIWVGEGATPIFEVIIPKIHDIKADSCRGR